MEVDFDETFNNLGEKERMENTNYREKVECKINGLFSAEKMTAIQQSISEKNGNGAAANPEAKDSESKEGTQADTAANGTKGTIPLETQNNGNGAAKQSKAADNQNEETIQPNVTVPENGASEQSKGTDNQNGEATQPDVAGPKTEESGQSKASNDEDKKEEQPKAAVENEQFYAYELLGNVGYSKGNSFIFKPQKGETVLVHFRNINEAYVNGSLSNKNKDNIMNEKLMININENTIIAKDTISIRAEKEVKTIAPKTTYEVDE